jgi:hypothetical protein
MAQFAAVLGDNRNAVQNPSSVMPEHALSRRTR